MVNKQKLINVEAGDAQSLVNHFKRKQAEDPMFFYAIQVDQENRITNFFFFREMANQGLIITLLGMLYVLTIHIELTSII